jgi:aspartate racemase
MGPQATLDLQQKILDLTEARQDQEHLHVYVDNYPQIPDRIGAVVSNSQSPVPAIQESLDKLASLGAACIVMPCVSAHYFLPRLNIPPRVMFLDMLQITAEACAKSKGKLTAGVLCSEATAHSGLFTPYLQRLALPYLYPQEEDQRALGRMILSVKAKADLPAVAAGLRPIAAEMAARGAGYFVLACTELPLLVQSGPLPYPCIDATAELAKAAIISCGYRVNRE